MTAAGACWVRTQWGAPRAGRCVAARPVETLRAPKRHPRPAQPSSTHKQLTHTAVCGPARAKVARRKQCASRRALRPPAHSVQQAVLLGGIMREHASGSGEELVGCFGGSGSLRKTGVDLIQRLADP